jgi:hypothetical protein
MRDAYVHIERGETPVRVRHTEQEIWLEFLHAEYPACWTKVGADVLFVLRAPEDVIRGLNLTVSLQIGKTKSHRNMVFTGVPIDASAEWQLRDQSFR